MARFAVNLPIFWSRYCGYGLPVAVEQGAALVGRALGCMLSVYCAVKGKYYAICEANMYLVIRSIKCGC